VQDLAIGDRIHSIPSHRYNTTKIAKINQPPFSLQQQQIQQVRQLPIAKQQFVMEMLDTVIQQTAN
jgi:hypothetical protein